jgi:AraC-like DNA-binding protein
LVVDPSAKLADLGTPFDAKDLQNLDTSLKNMGNVVRDTSEDFLTAVQTLADLPNRITADWIGPALSAVIIRVLIEFIHLPHAKPQTEKEQDQTIVAAQIFMKQHLEKRLDMGAIATRFGLGRSTFFSRFHRATGQSPLDWILRQRCQEACRLLESPEPSITSIALRSGFGSSQYFSRVMRRITGLTPTQYRQGRVVPPKDGK